MTTPQPVITDDLRRATAAAEAGWFDEAETACRQILAANPSDPGALCLAGALAAVTSTIGIGTLQSLRAAGASVLAIEAGRTILVDPDELADFAGKSGITITSFFDEAGAAGLRPGAKAA